MTILRVRAEAIDEIGSLGRLASAIAACRGNIVALDVHTIGGARVAHEFLVELGDADRDQVLARALRRAGGGQVDLERRHGEAPVDPVARALSVGLSVLSPGSDAAPGSRWPDRRLEAAVATLVRADRARLITEEDRAGWPVLLQAALTGHPVIRRWATGSPGGTSDPVWVLALADASAPCRRWVIVERRAPCFSASEVARIEGLLRLAHAGATAARGAAHPHRAELGPPRLVRRRPASFFRHGCDAAATTTPSPPPVRSVTGSTG